MAVFHWCNLPLKRKWKEIATVYDAAEAIEGDWKSSPFVSLSFSLCLPLSEVGGVAGGGSPTRKLFRYVSFRLFVRTHGGDV